MEQRRLRLGDILDDYCPRERRVTNHAVVAMVEETVKQTRCTTCDAEHPYKGGQAPRRRKKEGTSALFKEVLAGKPDTEIPTGHDDGEAYAAADLPAGGSGGPDGHDEANGNVMSENDLPPATMVSRPAPAARREPAPEPPSAFQPVVLAASDQAGPDSGVPGRRAAPLRYRRGPCPPSVDPRAIAAHRGSERRTAPNRLHHPSVWRSWQQRRQPVPRWWRWRRKPAAIRSRRLRWQRRQCRRQCRARGEWPQTPRPVRALGAGAGPGPGPGSGPRSRSGRRLQVGTAATARWRPKTISIARRTLFCYSGGSHV